MKNIVFYITISIAFKMPIADRQAELEKSMQPYDNIYSYLIYADYDNSQWLVKFAINEIDKYNTLPRETSINEILCTFDTQTDKHIIGYKQPSFEILCTLYEPLMNALAYHQCQQWTELEYDDAVSICKLTMLKLYKKGYYLHKSLIKKAYTNEVLMSLRSNKADVTIVSLDKVVYSSDSDQPISLGDTIVDNSEELAEEQEEHDEMVAITFANVKRYIVAMIGERRFEQLFRDYAYKHTTSITRKELLNIKNKLKQKHLTIKDFGGKK